MTTERVNKLANEGIYQKEYFEKKQYVYNRRLNEVLLTILFNVILILVQCYLKL